jgi:mitochondrial fission protein ELM1
VVDRRLILWFFPDGKAGHERQVTALIDALSKLCSVESHAVPPLRLAQALWILAGKRDPRLVTLPRPHLILVAGRGTHWSGLAARRAHGGRLVVLMRPGLPASWFDLCIVPRHDGVAPAECVFTIMGALTQTSALAMANHRTSGLILIGGPSRHFGWDEASLLAQIREVVTAEPERAFTIADSRRTPEQTSQALRCLAGDRISFASHRTTVAGWIDRQYQHSNPIWVTRDSVSMVYESIASGAAVGLLEVPKARPNGRLARAIDGAVQEGLAVPFSAWRSGAPLQPPRLPLREADRCASEIVQRWFSSGLRATTGADEP